MIKGLFKLSKTGVVFGLKKYYKDKTVRTIYAIGIGLDAMQVLILGNRVKVGEKTSGLLLFCIIAGYLPWMYAKGIFIKLDIGYRTIIDHTKILRYYR